MTVLSDAAHPWLDPAHGEVRFGGLVVEQSKRVLAARNWTSAQSRWAARLALELDDDRPALELYAGAGQIGLEFVRLTGRSLVQVDASAEACRLARRNADRNGLGHLVTIRHRPVSVPLRSTQPFSLVLADPPYVPTIETARYADDPAVAIDGGPDGLAHIRELLRALPAYLRPTTPVLLQVRGTEQAGALQGALLELGAPLRLAEIRSFGPDRAVVLLRPR